MTSNRYVSQAKQLAEKAIDMRRKQIDRFINHSANSIADLEKLQAIQATIDLAAVVLVDEERRKHSADYASADENGLLVDDGAGNRLLPQA